MLASTSSGLSGRPWGFLGFSRNSRMARGFSGFTSITPNWSASEIGCRIAATVQGDHLREVQPVDVVGAYHDDDVRPVVSDQVEGLVDRVGTAEVPVLADPL